MIDMLSGASDPDGTAPLNVQNVSPLPEGVTLAGTTLIVDVSSDTYHALAVGETLELVVPYDIVDEFSAAVPQTVTITIIGENDAPTVSAALFAAAQEDDAAFTINMLDGAQDIDLQGALVVQNISALPTGVVLNGPSLDVDPSNAAFQSLALGQSTTLTVTFDIADDQGAVAAQTVNIALTGTNDAPTVAGALSATANEDDAGFTLNLLDGASDVDNDAVLSVANVAGLVDGFILNGTTLEVDPSGAFYQPLAVGESLSYTVPYDVVDENGGSVAQSATVVINGTNDAPVAVGSVDTQFVQTGVAYSLVLDPNLFFDVDASDTLTLSATLANGDPLPSWMTFDPATGTFSGTPNGPTATLHRVTVTATDLHDASATAKLWLGEGDSFLSGSSAANEIVTSGNTSSDGDILFGGEGTDVLIGLNPSEIFVVTEANDLTVIDESGFRDTDVLLLDGIDPADVTLERRHPASSDLVISVNGVALVLVLNTLNGSRTDEIEVVAFGDGSTLGIAEIRALILEQRSSTDADIAAGFAGADVLNGGAGNDFLSGG